jgi:hypothetical protein
MRSPHSGTPNQTSPPHPRTTAVYSPKTSPLASRARVLIHTGDHSYVATAIRRRNPPTNPLHQDISARSPIQDNVHETYPRQSLDARQSLDVRRSVDTRRSLDVRRSRATPRSSTRHSESHDEVVPEEGFEEVGLNDEPKAPQQPKKRSIFSRFGDSSEKVEERPTSGHHFSLTGRKRAESGGGAEMKSMGRVSSEVNGEGRS